MRTKIHTTKKLQKLVQKIIGTDENTESGILGKWNATVFYVDRKKCWLITNGLTKYNIVLPDIKATDLSRIEQIFKNALFEQLKYDGIFIGYEKLNAIIGGIDFLPTDNDRSTTGFQNQRLFELGWWKHDYASLEEMPITDLTNRMNTTPIQIDKDGRKSDYTDSIKAMRKVFSSLNNT